MTVHGLIHLMGAAKELGWAQLTELSERVSAVGGVAWLLTALLVLTAGLLLAVRAGCGGLSWQRPPYSPRP